MAFRPNYNQQRSERQRAARAKSEEKQKRLDEKTAERKAAREASGLPPEDAAERNVETERDPS
jgi:hypothetical protein